jgi:hypothetical protein
MGLSPESLKRNFPAGPVRPRGKNLVTVSGTFAWKKFQWKKFLKMLRTFWILYENSLVVIFLALLFSGPKTFSFFILLAPQSAGAPGV